MQTDFSIEAMSLLGCWNLLSFELRPERGEVIRPFGDNPHGMIIYTASGRFSAQLMRGDRPRCISEDQMHARLPEAELNFKGCISYYGSYTLHPDKGVVLHRVEGSLFPNWEGRSLKRFCRFSDDGTRLELSTPPTVWGGGGTIVGVIQWEKVGN